MNNLIRELVNQADIEVAHMECNRPRTEFEIKQQWVEKFAELIVQECASFILDSLEAANINLTSRPDDDYWLGFRHACDDHLTDIKEHFGVE